MLALVTGLVAAPPCPADEPPPREPAIEPIKVDLTEQNMMIEGVVVGLVRNGMPLH